MLKQVQSEQESRKHHWDLLTKRSLLMILEDFQQAKEMIYVIFYCTYHNLLL